MKPACWVQMSKGCGNNMRRLLQIKCDAKAMFMSMSPRWAALAMIIVTALWESAHYFMIAMQPKLVQQGANILMQRQNGMAVKDNTKRLPNEPVRETGRIRQCLLQR
jgi:hypothetical protein